METPTPNLPASPPVQRPCRGCGCPLVMAVNLETARTVPLDRRTPVYVHFRDEHRGEFAWDLNLILATTAEIHLRTADGMKRLDVIGVHATHFATCPKAAAFSRKRT